jgi:hypothetical protein
MTTLPSMSLVLPVRGAAGSGTWHNALDAALTLIDGHDHSPGKGPRINTDGIAIDDDLSFSSLYAPTALHRVSFSAVTTLTSNNRSLFVSATDNELYFRNNSGTNIKLTSGTSLNVAAFTGGIGGDYASVGAEVAFDDAGDRYTFKQNSATGWARLASGEVRILETGSGDSVYVGLAAPVALAASHTITLPLAAPGSTSLVQMDSSGVLTASNTVANAATFSSAVTLTGGITNNVTLTLGATAAVNQSITVSGTGRYKHPARELVVHISAFRADGASAYVPFNQVGYIDNISAVCTIQAWVPIEVGKRILTYQQFYNVNGGGSVTPKLRRMAINGGAVNDVAAGVLDNTNNALESQTISGINHTVLSGQGYFIEVAVTNALNQVWGAIITYDDP